MEVKGGSGLRILVGDDDRVNQLVIQGMLKKLGRECLIASTGKQVIETVRSEPTDLVFLDIQLPDINGFEVVRQIQKTGEIERKPRIAFVSGHDASDFRDELVELDVSLFVTKPITAEALTKVLDAL